MRRDVRLWVAGMLVMAVLSAAVDAEEAARSLEERCQAEVVELHEFLERWSNAELPDTDEAFARFDRVIAPGFLIIDPDGSRIERQPIVDAVRAFRGRWSETPGKIRIESFRLHHAGGGFALATYEEWHDLAGGGNGRLSSVLFGEDEEAPNGLVWLHLHEVWIEPAGGDG